MSNIRRTIEYHVKILGILLFALMFCLLRFHPLFLQNILNSGRLIGNGKLISLLSP